MKVLVNIDKLLSKNTMSLYELSKRTWISYNALKSIRDNTTSKIEFDTIEKLLLAFKCKPDDLFKITN